MVKNILKNGTVIADLTGHIVRMEDAKTVYTIAERMSKRKDCEKWQRTNR